VTSSQNLFQIGKLSSHDHLREDGQYNINLEDKSALFEGIASPTEVLLTHGVNIEDAPPSFKVRLDHPKINIAFGIIHRLLYSGDCSK